MLNVILTEIASSSPDDQGAMVFGNGKLVAFLTRLDDEIHGHYCGRWFLEIGFGRCGGVDLTPFVDLPDALRWIASRLDLPNLSAADLEESCRNAQSYYSNFMSA